MTAPVWAIRGDDAAVADHVAAHVRPDRPCHLALAGGATPVPILRSLRTRDLAWHRATLWPTDERLVPETDRHSNFGMIDEALGQTPAWICPLRRDAVPPRFDLLWLGMGDDGKIASLFPNQADGLGATPAVRHVRPDPLPDHAPFERLTLNLAALANSAQIILVIRGTRKRALVEQAIAGNGDLPLTRLLCSATTPIRIFWTA